MSIEKRIEDLIAALEKNTAAITAFNSVDRTVQKVLDKAVEQSIVAEVREQTLNEESQEITYDQVVTAFRKYVTDKGRDPAVALLAKFGITGKLTQDQLPEAKYAEFLEAAK